MDYWVEMLVPGAVGVASIAAGLATHTPVLVSAGVSFVAGFYLTTLYWHRRSRK